MIGNYRVVAVVPARGGSKGLPGKNIKPLMGKPVIAYTIEQAKQSKHIDRIIVSTEDFEIAEVSKEYGAEIPFMRPAELSRDNSSTIDVLLHAIDWLEKEDNYFFEILVLLHVTTPLRDVEDIEGCINLLVDKNAGSVFSVTEAHRNPYFNMVEMKNNQVRLVKKGNYVSRQMAPEVFDMNSSIYVWWKDIFKKKRSVILKNSCIYVMPKVRSVDIDDSFDFKVAEMLLSSKDGNVA